METQRSDRYWQRIKYVVGLVFISLLLYLGAYIAQGVSAAEPLALSSYPVVTIFAYTTAIGIVVAPLPIIYFISKDKTELAKEFSEVTERHWLTVGIFTMFTAGVYPLWYSVARYRVDTTDDETAEETAAVVADDGAATDDYETPSDPQDEEIPAAAEHSPQASAASSNVDTRDSSGSLDELLIMDDGSDSPSQPDQPDSEEPTADDTTSNETAATVEELQTEGSEWQNKASGHLEAGDYESAVAAYAEAQAVYEEAVTFAAEHDLVDVIPLRQTLDSITTQKREAHFDQLQRDIDTISSTITEAKTHAQDGDFESAQTLLEELTPEIETTEQQILDADFTDLHDEISHLKDQQETYLEAATAQLQQPPIPETIPDAPRVTVAYDDLTEDGPIARGGNADVKAATVTDSTDEVTLAIKEPRMAGTLHTDAVDRIIAEAETWDKLDDHEHIVGVVDYDSDPLPWIAMEYMDGGHLGERAGDLDTLQALWTALSVTKGVRHAHRRGVAHLDLKPANILFRTTEDGWDVPKVTDWGLSKHLLDHSNSIEGFSPQYAAPEQFDDEYGSTDDITDIYQLGAVFYELFTGQPPFDGKPFKVIGKVKSQSPTPPSDIAAVPAELDDILLTALAKSKADRYDNIVYLRDELQSLFDTTLEEQKPTTDVFETNGKLHSQ